jgi:hypothetical protein
MPQKGKPGRRVRLLFLMDPEAFVVVPEDSGHRDELEASSDSDAHYYARVPPTRENLYLLDLPFGRCISTRSSGTTTGVDRKDGRRAWVLMADASEMVLRKGHANAAVVEACGAEKTFASGGAFVHDLRRVDLDLVGL